MDFYPSTFFCSFSLQIPSPHRKLENPVWTHWDLPFVFFLLLKFAAGLHAGQQEMLEKCLNFPMK